MDSEESKSEFGSNSRKSSRYFRNEWVSLNEVLSLRNPSGNLLYGWSVNGEIYLTDDGLNSETPVHEYTHLWCIAMQKNNHEVHSRPTSTNQSTKTDEASQSAELSGTTTDSSRDTASATSFGKDMDSISNIQENQQENEKTHPSVIHKFR